MTKVEKLKSKILDTIESSNSSYSELIKRLTHSTNPAGILKFYGDTLLVEAARISAFKIFLQEVYQITTDDILKDYKASKINQLIAPRSINRSTSMSHDFIEEQQFCFIADLVKMIK